MRRHVAVLTVAAAVAIPAAAHARTTATLDGGTIVFFSDTLSVVAREGARLRLADGTTASGDAAYVDLKNDRVVLAGNAHVTHGSTSLQADAVAVDLDSDRVDLLDATSGVQRTTRRLAAPAPAEIDAQRFAFPDVDDHYAFIRSRHATIVTHANVRFTPASFPTSVGGVPVPTYLYTFATAAGFGANTLPGATFDQPYGLFGSPTALTSLHARWESTAPALALQQQLAAGDNAYVTAAIDAPFRSYSSSGISAYRRMGERYTVTLGGSAGFGYRQGDAAVTGAFGRAGARISYHRQSGGFSSFDTSVRTPDYVLPGGSTLRLTADVGFDAQHGGALFPYSTLPDGRRYGTVWRHGLDAFVASPILRGPLGTTLGMTLDASRTWYAFPHQYDQVTGTANASKRIARAITLFAGYANTWTSQVYPGNQSRFYPTPPVTPLIAWDGTPYLGWNAYQGAAVSRYMNFDVQIAPPRTSTSVRVSLRHTNDFLQFDGIGRPQWELRGDAQFRPVPNAGIALGRTYDFDWGGRRWVPGWSFAITQ